MNVRAAIEVAATFMKIPSVRVTQFVENLLLGLACPKS
jgi:hypothetical protein